MKKLISLFCVLVLLLVSFPVARAEDAGAFVEVAAESGRLSDVIRLRNDGSEEDMLDDQEELYVILAVKDLGVTKRNGPVFTTFDSIYIAEMIENDDETARYYYGAEGGVPFLFIRFAYTVENRGTEAVTMPKSSEYAWIVTNDGEIVKGRVGTKADGTIPNRIEPGETASAYLFFFCHNTVADYLTFFSMFLESPILDNGARYGPKLGLSFEILENALEQAEALS